MTLQEFYNQALQLGATNVEFGSSILEASFNMLKWCKQNNHI